MAEALANRQMHVRSSVGMCHILLAGGTVGHVCPAELWSLLDSTVAAVTLRAL